MDRTFSQGQSRFTQVDPLNMAAGNIVEPQSNNLYAYVQNMPIDFVDPSGLNEEAPIVIETWVPGERYNPSQCYTLYIDGMEYGRIGSFGGGGGYSGGSGPGVGGAENDDPCSVTFRVFPQHADQWTGMARKTNTQDKHQYGTAMTAHLIREIGNEWSGNGDPDIRIGDISLMNGADSPDHLEHQKGYQLDIGLSVNGGREYWRG